MKLEECRVFPTLGRSQKFAHSPPPPGKIRPPVDPPATG